MIGNKGILIEQHVLQKQWSLPTEAQFVQQYNFAIVLIIVALYIIRYIHLKCILLIDNA